MTTSGDRGANDVANELTCPKCAGTMRSYERNGVHVDQCTGCLEASQQLDCE